MRVIQRNYLALLSPCLFSVCTILSCSQSDSPPAQTTFYVSPTGSDSNPGTLAAPWQTIGKAGLTLVAGDTAILRDGIYTEPEINISHSGTQTKPIMIRAENKHKAILIPTACTTGISVRGSYVTIEDIRVGTPPLNPSCPSTASRATIRCWEQGAAPNRVGDQTTGFRGCTIRGVLIEYGTTLNVGIKTNQDYTLVENSEINMNLEAFNNFGTVFRNNIVHSKVEGLQGTAISAKGGVRNLEVYNNIIDVGPGDIGLILGGNSSQDWFDDSHFEAFNSVAYNNVVIAQGLDSAALGMVGAKDSALYNNIVIGGQIFLTTGSQTGFPPQPSPENPTIKNNIITCGGGAATGLFNGWISTGLDLDHNNFFNCLLGSTPPQVHSVVGDPLFVDPNSDWHLKINSSALGSGVALVPFPGFNVGETLDVSKNRDGIVRPLPWNLGIY